MSSIGGSKNSVIQTEDGNDVSDSNPLPVKIGDGTNTAVVNSDGQLHVVMEGKIDTDNTTVTPLLADAVFTGEWVNVLSYPGIGVLVGADVPGTLLVQYSSNGTDEHDGEQYDILAISDKFFSPPRMSAYYRLVYTNGDADQTTFYIHPILSKQPFKWSSHNIDDPIVDQDDAELVKAVITGKKVNGDYDNVSLTNGANMKVSLEELESSISVNSNTQLKVTLFASDGNEFDQDTMTGAFVTADYAHHKIHSGDHFYNKDWTDLLNGATYDILVSVVDTTKWPHFEFLFGAEAEFNMILYAGVTASNNGTALTVVNRNGNSGTANGLLAFHTPTITDLGTQIGRYKGGSAKRVGGLARANNEQILPQNAKFLARVTNDTTSNNWIDWLLDWYEKEAV